MTQNYIALYFNVVPVEPWAEILLAELTVLPFESFEFTATGLNAFIPESLWHENLLDDLHLLDHAEVRITYTQKNIPAENWNARWESEFSPLYIDDRCVVRADFHPPSEAPLELVITPRMSFGTGHHQTTQMMLNYGLDLNVKDSTVLDMGCGTGILAILAAKREALEVHGIDHDANCVSNSQENALRNGQKNIQFWQDEVPPQQENSYDFIFANINKNVILSQLADYYFCLKPKGHLILSGFFVSEISNISEKAESLGFELASTKENEQWAAIDFTK
jgi:ribosomal protein L11 methyltransferase